MAEKQTQELTQEQVMQQYLSMGGQSGLTEYRLCQSPTYQIGSENMNLLLTLPACTITEQSLFYLQVPIVIPQNTLPLPFQKIGAQDAVSPTLKTGVQIYDLYSYFFPQIFSNMQIFFNGQNLQSIGLGSNQLFQIAMQTMQEHSYNEKWQTSERDHVFIYSNTKFGATNNTNNWLPMKNLIPLYQKVSSTIAASPNFSTEVTLDNLIIPIPMFVILQQFQNQFSSPLCTISDCTINLQVSNLSGTNCGYVSLPGESNIVSPFYVNTVGGKNIQLFGNLCCVTQFPLKKNPSYFLQRTQYQNIFNVASSGSVQSLSIKLGAMQKILEIQFVLFKNSEDAGSSPFHIDNFLHLSNLCYFKRIMLNQHQILVNQQFATSQLGQQNSILLQQTQNKKSRSQKPLNVFCYSPPLQSQVTDSQIVLNIDAVLADQAASANQTYGLSVVVMCLV